MFSRYVAIVGFLSLFGWAAPAHAEKFSIMFIFSDSLSNSTQALMAGGYTKGVEKGMRGDLFTYGKDSALMIGKAEVVDVTQYESSCLLWQTDSIPLSAGQMIRLEIDEPSAGQLLERGQAAFEAEDYERAYYCLTRLLQDYPTTDTSDIQPLIDESVRKTEAEFRRRLTRKERQQESQRIPTYLTLAQHYLARNMLEPAEAYCVKVLRVDDNNGTANEIAKAIRELRKYDAAVESADAAVDSEDQPPELVPPEMTKQVAPWYPVEAGHSDTDRVTWVKALVSSTGIVCRAYAWRSSGNRILDDAAVSAAFFNRFKPARLNGKRVHVWVVYQVSFEAND